MFRLEDGPRVASLAHAGVAGGHGTLMRSCSRGVVQLNSVDRAAAVMAVTAAFWIRRSAVIA
jgi:hypothetical protein